MKIPTFLNHKWVNKDQNLSDFAAMYEDEMNRSMQGALSDNGWTLPQIESADLTELELNPLTAMPDGTMWYVTDTVPPVMVVKIDGALTKVTTAAYP